MAKKADISKKEVLAENNEVLKAAEGLNNNKTQQTNEILDQTKTEIKETLLQKKKEILSQIENKTGFETEQILAQAFNLPVQVYEKLTPQKDGSVRIEATATKEQLAKILEAKDLLSHVKHNPSWIELFVLCAEFVIAKKSWTAGAGLETVSLSI
jgi:hypothetical protein